MPLHIHKSSEVPLHQQLRQQIIFQISTGELPIGAVMPSARQLERQIKVHHNTVFKVCSELADQHWLVREKGRRFVVVHPSVASPAQPGDAVDALIDRLLIAAQAEGVALDQLIEQIKGRPAIELPDHFLIVEPEPAMGEVMKYEVQKATGRDAVSYPIPELKCRPELLGRAVLLVPAYLADLMDFVPLMQRTAMRLLVYSPIRSHIEALRSLADSCVVGMISVSGPGMKTMDGVLAEGIGSRHRLLPFFLQWPPKRPGEVVIRKLTTKQLPHDIDVRLLGQHAAVTEGKGSAATASTLQAPWHADLPLGSMEDLRAVDLLFCDSIAYDAVRHPRRIKYQLLSPESLREIAAVAERLPGFRKTAEADGG
jgi:DNA-binding transcriptional regulator YhcF (GntR family)